MTFLGLWQSINILIKPFVHWILCRCRFATKSGEISTCTLTRGGRVSSLLPKTCTKGDGIFYSLWVFSEFAWNFIFSGILMKFWWMRSFCLYDRLTNLLLRVLLLNCKYTHFLNLIILLFISCHTLEGRAVVWYSIVANWIVLSCVFSCMYVYCLPTMC